MAEGQMKLEEATNLLKENIDGADDVAAFEILEECSKWTLEYIYSRLTPAQVVTAKQILEQGSE